MMTCRMLQLALGGGAVIIHPGEVCSRAPHSAPDHGIDCSILRHRRRPLSWVVDNPRFRCDLRAKTARLRRAPALLC